MLLASLLSQILFYPHLQEQAFELLASINNEVRNIHSDDFHSMILPYLHGLLTAVLAWGSYSSSSEYGPKISTAAQSVFQQYLARYVRSEPERSKTWIRNALPPHCDICAWLSRFLQDPTAKTGRFACARKSRRHPELRIGDVSDRGGYITETEHSGKRKVEVIDLTDDLTGNCC